MSETNQEQGNTTVPTSPGESIQVRNMREFTNLGVESDADSNDTSDIVYKTDNGESVDLVTENELQSLLEGDDLIHERYNGAAQTFHDIKQRADNTYEAATKLINKNIADAKVAFEERRRLIDAQADSKIEGINLWRQRKIGQEVLEQAGRIADNKRSQAKADSHRSEALAEIKELFNAVEDGQTHQVKFELDRDQSVELLNLLLERKNQLETDLNTAKETLSTSKSSLYRYKVNRDELLDEETKLNAVVSVRREDAVDVRIQNFRKNYKSSQELPEDINETAKNITDNASSESLIRALGELEVCHEKQEHNRVNIRMLKEIIEESKLRISTINDELEKLDPRISQVKAKLDDEIKDSALEIMDHSAYVARIAEAFEIIINGDMTEAAKKVIPNRLRSVFIGMAEYLSEIGMGSDEVYAEKWEVPDFDMTLPPSFKDGDDDTEGSLRDEQQMIETIKLGSEKLGSARIFNNVRLLGQAAKRSVLSRGVGIIYKDKPEDAAR